MNHIVNSIVIKKFEVRDTDAFLSLQVPSLVVREICERKIIKWLQAKIETDYSKNLVIEFIIESAQQEFTLNSELSPQLPELHIRTNPIEDSNFQFKHKYALSSKMKFENMIETEENRFSMNALKFFIEDSSMGINSAALFGSSGIGKSHLLNATGWHYLATFPGKKVKIVSGDEFINDFQTAIFTKTMGEFRNKYRLKTDVLLIDDLQSIERAKATQGELFNLFNEYSTSGKKVIITSDKKIEELFGFDERLKSRFLGGLVLQMDRPSLVSLKQYFDFKIMNSRMYLSSEVQETIFYNLGNCFRSVDGAVARLEMLQRINGVIDLESVKKMFPIQNTGKHNQVSADQIIIDVARKHNLMKSDLVGPSRKREIFQARREAIVEIREKLQLSFKEIGRIFNRDHSTIVSAIN